MGHSIAVMSVLDNRNKGAAGGAIRCVADEPVVGFAETAGLTTPAPGWT